MTPAQRKPIPEITRPAMRLSVPVNVVVAGSSIPTRHLLHRTARLRKRKRARAHGHGSLLRVDAGASRERPRRSPLRRGAAGGENGDGYQHTSSPPITTAEKDAVVPEEM